MDQPDQQPNLKPRVLEKPKHPKPFVRWVGNATIAKYYNDILYKNYQTSKK